MYMCSSKCLCVQYKKLLAILEFLASLPYAASVKDFIYKYRKLLQPRSLFTEKPQVTFTYGFISFDQLGLVMVKLACLFTYLFCFV